MTDASANKRAWAEAFDTEASSADGVEVHVFVGPLAEDAEKRLVIGPRAGEFTWSPLVDTFEAFVAKGLANGGLTHRVVPRAPQRPDALPSRPFPPFDYNLE